jgi:DNA-binding CsgD family transcriptional regulator
VTGTGAARRDEGSGSQAGRDNTAWAGRGHSNKEIAGRLVISPKTVGNHIEHIYIKTGCSSRAEASLYAMQQGLLGELRGAQK